MILLKKSDLRRCFNFPVTATYDKYVSFLENFAPCISGFLSRIRFQDSCNIIIPDYSSDTVLTTELRLKTHCSMDL